MASDADTNDALRIPSPLPGVRQPSKPTDRAGLRRRSAYLADLISGHAHSHGGYDGEYKLALSEGEVGNGVRTWYSTFTTIDWLHDHCKENSRQKHLRAVPGIRGVLGVQWDRFQGWVAVLLTGAFTAVIAFGIISLEMWLFDIKDGYCTTAWYRARRFCACQDASNNPAAVSPLRIVSQAPVMRSAIAARSFIHAWAGPRFETASENGQHCTAWQEWSSVLDGEGSKPIRWMLEYGIYVLMALVFATFASTLTIYLSSSESVVSAKDVSAASSEKDSHGQTSTTGRGGMSNTLPRSASYQSYGTVTFGSRSKRGRASQRQLSLDTTFSEPLLTPRSQPSPGRTSVDGDDGTNTGNEHTPHFSAPEVVPRKVMYYAAGSGIPEIKTLLSGFVIRGYLGGWTLVAKAFGLCFSVGSGLSLGKEGPFVHIASCVGNIVTRFFPKYDRNEAKRREVLSAACAAGVAVSFGAPVGGVLFSLEEVSYFFPAKVLFRSFVCAMVAAVTLRLLDPFGSGKIVLFEVTYDKDFHWVEMIAFSFLGIFGGLYGALFNKANIAWTKHVRNGTSLKRHPILEVALIVTLTAAISFLNPFTKMGGTELVFELFSECHQENSSSFLCPAVPSQVAPLVKSILFALLAKALLTVITFGIKLPAGIFIPTLAVGACVGRIVGLGIEYAFALHPDSALFGFCAANGPLPAPFGQACVLPGVYSMVGAAAALAGVTRTTVSLAVIMFELTGTLTYVTPVMLAVLFAKTVADAIETRSIYDLTIEMNKLPYLDAKEEHIFSGSVMDVVDTSAPLIVLGSGNTVEAMRGKLAANEGRVTGFPVVRLAKGDDGPRLQGYIGFDEMQQALLTHERETVQRKLGGADPSASTSATRCTFMDAAGWNASESESSEYDQNMRGGTDEEAAEHQDTEHYEAGPTLELGYLTDRAPVTVSARAPMQLLHQLFVKLGVRYLAVQDDRGCYVGTIEKNRWLGYLTWLEEEGHK